MLDNTETLVDAPLGTRMYAGGGVREPDTLPRTMWRSWVHKHTAHSRSKIARDVGGIPLSVRVYKQYN